LHARGLCVVGDALRCRRGGLVACAARSVRGGLVFSNKTHTVFAMQTSASLGEVADTTKKTNKQKWLVAGARMVCMCKPHMHTTNHTCKPHMQSSTAVHAGAMLLTMG